MLKNTLTGLNKKKLRRWLLLFFFALVIPTVILIQQSYSRLKWETFHQHQLMADELSSRIDDELLRLIEIEEQRSFTDYSFLNIVGDPKANLLQRSPLSKFPIESEIAGLIGYFQVDNNGRLQTPLLPDSISLANYDDSYGIAKKELILRIQLKNKIQSILSQNSLVKASVSLVREKENRDIKDDYGAKKPIENRAKKSINGNINSSIQFTPSISNELAQDSSAKNDDGGISYMAEQVSKPSVLPNAQVAFDRLKTVAPKHAQRETKLGRVEDFKFGKTYSKEVEKQKIKKSKLVSINKLTKHVRKEKNILPEREPSNKELDRQILSKKNRSASLLENKNTTNNFLGNQTLAMTAASPENKSIFTAPKKLGLRIRTFESTIDTFEFSQLDSDHFVFFRNVWLNDKRTIQGLIIAQKPFLENIVNAAFRNTSLSQMSDLLVSNQGNVLAVFTAQPQKNYLSKRSVVNGELNGELLYETRLSDPLSELQLLFSIKQLPVGAGGKIILWISLLLALVLCTGFYLMYRLGIGQINLANQQQDFVSAVSHELKTPLTSIRMYSEILREGWANDEKKKSYYDFIFDESERLSRLINNVLHLARVTRNKQSPELKKITVAELMDGIRSKVSTQISHGGFAFIIHCNEDSKNSTLEVDEDWFSQIMINLVDNAIKFSADTEQKKIELNSILDIKGHIQFSIRDYGPGVKKTQMKKIFDLFYRTESELTRETVGTGIGLALVHQMTVSMKGKIDVVNRDPGAEFRVAFPLIVEEGVS